ncbi:MAG: peptidylprolyl isomerase [Candidatus Eisenbacteria bacterium]|nr:peptidylprolyl isomerase [Candidatus Eisenbacteria bacterium]
MRSSVSVAMVAAILLAVVVAGAQETEEQAPVKQLSAERSLVDGIAAVVGDEIILESEVDEELYIYQMRAGSIPQADALKVRSEIVRGMIEETLLVAMARRDTIELAPGELGQEMDKRVEELVERHGSRDALMAALESEGLTLERLRTIYRKEIERRLLAQKVVRSEVQSKITVTWREVDDYYNEHADEVARVPEAYHVAGMLVTPKISEAAKRAAIDRLNEAVGLLESGASFEEVAARYSDDNSAARGGDLGVITRGMMVPEFEDAVFALEEGEISGVVPTRFGFHIVQVTEKGNGTVRARHILARVSPGPEDDVRARATADSLKARVIAGEDFSELARRRSDDPISRENGGDLGWFARKDLSDTFYDVLKDLVSGEVGEIVKGETGYYVLRLLEHKDERIASLDEIRDDLKDLIFARKAEEAYNKLIDRLSKEIFVDVRTEMVSEE